MLKTKYVTDHEKKIVKAERGLYGYVKVFLVFSVLITMTSIVLDVFIGFPAISSCLDNPSRTDEDCYEQSRSIKRGTNLLSFVGVGASIASKLSKDAEKRYEDLEEKS